MSLEEKIGLLEEIMELDEGTLEVSSVLDEYEEWDSLSKLSLLGVAKERFGKRLTASEINEFNTVQDICDFLQ